MSCLKDAILEYAENLEQDSLVSISEGIHNRAHAKALREIVERCEP